MTDFALSGFQLGLGLGERSGFGARRRSPPSVGGFILPFPDIEAIDMDTQFCCHSDSRLTATHPMIYRFAFKSLIERTTFSDRSLAHDVGSSLFAPSHLRQFEATSFLSSNRRTFSVRSKISLNILPAFYGLDQTFRRTPPKTRTR